MDGKQSGLRGQEGGQAGPTGRRSRGQAGGCERSPVTPAAEAVPGADQELRYRNTLDAEQAAYQAAGLAKLTPLIIMAKTEHPIGDMLLSAIFPEHQDSHCIGFCVTVEPGRIIAQHDPATDDADDGDMSIRIRDAIRLEVGEVVHAALLERVGSHALRCLKQALYPGILLPEGWREVVPTDRTDWADEDVAYSEFFGVPVGELIERC